MHARVTMESTSLARGENKDFYEAPIEWQIETKTIPYLEALAQMESRALAIAQNEAPELIWLLEHPPLYTVGTSGNDADILNASHLPVFYTGRGGQVTYHGPGQRIAYLMLNLKHRGSDIRAYVRSLEMWLIRALELLSVRAFRAEGRVGIWVNVEEEEKKIAAIGVRVKKWVTLHGISLNVKPDLFYYHHIIPCGLPQYGVTSLADLGIKVSMKNVDQALQVAFQEFFPA